MSQKNRVTYLGIRHHGPGSARSVVQALNDLEPDLILLEGPAEADPLLSLVPHRDMKPPVALLVFAVDNLNQTVFYPFTNFSPEWQAILFALNQKVPLQFFDLPQTHQLALTTQNQEEEMAIEELLTEATEDEEEHESPIRTPSDNQTTPSPIPFDPLDLMAHAAGFSDGERWWEFMVEQRQGDLDLFQGIQEAMTALRSAIEKEGIKPLSQRESMREAWMRESIRKAQKKYKNIAVICGAWHVPAIAQKADEKADKTLLKTLPKTKVQATWVPWTNGRISYTSGYGAGIHSPGWYEHLWDCETKSPHRARKISAGWLSRVAKLLRDEGLDVSTASVIECVRLSETLAALREKPLPGLQELNEAVIATFCFGDDTPLKLIHEKLIVGERLGEVPEKTPTVPLQQDLTRLQKSLFLKPKAESDRLELDLRIEKKLAASQLLHRLNLLGVPWGSVTDAEGKVKGTFWEYWILKWEAEFSIRLIEANVWGTTIRDASSNYARHQLSEAHNLTDITGIIDHILLADLPESLDFAVERLESETAVASDVYQLMGALPPLANIMRYSNVRKLEAKNLVQVVDTLVTRICIGLPGGCSSLDDDAAEEMFTHISETHSAITLLQNENHLKEWWETLGKLIDQEGLHGLIAGRCYRLLLGGHIIEHEMAAKEMAYALSIAYDPLHSAAWIDGLLRGSGLLLLHDEQIWSVFNEWVSELDADSFNTLLPLLRRTFGSFAVVERRQMGEKVSKGGTSAGAVSLSPSTDDFDEESANATLPLIAQMLGLQFKPLKQKKK